MFRGGRRKRQHQTFRQPRHRVNERIKAPEIRVVTDSGEMLGVMSTSKALTIAKEKELDLVEISPKASPPVCKIIDFGKFLYEQKKREKADQKASKGHEIKGIRLSFRIGPGDIERQREKAKKFLATGHPVRIQMMLRGREKAHKPMAFTKLKEFVATLEEFGVLDQAARSSGFQIVAIMRPKGKTKPGE